MSYGRVRTYGVGEEMQYDDDDIPMINYGTYEYNPLTIAQYALTVYGRYLHGGDEADRERFLEVMEGLLKRQDEDGAFRYMFTWEYHLGEEPFEPGWVSGLTQGVALSALARAYDLTGDERFREAGDVSLEFMLTPISEGGTLTTLEDLAPELANYVFISEYPHDPVYYTLNGFMYSMVGLYDWADVMAGTPGADLAARYLECTTKTLELILPLYDVGGFTAYDLAQVMLGAESTNLNPHYHAVHIYLLHALDSIEENARFKMFEERWAEYVDSNTS